MKAAKEGEVQVEGAKRTRVSKGSVSVNAKGEALIKYTGGGGDTVQIHPDLVDAFALLGFEHFFKQLVAKAEDVDKLQAAVNEAALKIGAGEMPEIHRRAAKGQGKGNQLAQAIAEVHHVSVERATAWFEKLDRKDKLAVRRDPAVAAALARLSGKTDAPSVFSGLADSL